MMKTVFLLILILSTGLYTSVCKAQCGAGVNTGGQCIPPEVLYPSGDDGQYQRHQTSSAVWKKTWGAIVEDNETHSVGASVGLLSKSKAKKAATLACNENGGRNCNITWTYHNQCVAIAATPTRTRYVSAYSEDIAKKAALAGFGPDSGAYIAYSACSESVRIR